MTTTDDLDALTNEACNLAMTGVPHDDARCVDLSRRRLAAWFMRAGMAPLSMAEIYAALTQRLIAMGEATEQAATERAARMLVSWGWLSDNSVDGGTGRRTLVGDWADPEVVRLLDAALNAHFLGGEPYPAAPA